MADIDLMPARGIPFRARVDANGIAFGGSATVLELAQRGMQAVCIVDNTGVVGGVTIEQLAQRGIRAACLVDENGLASGVSADELRRRGIRPLVSLTSAGLSGLTTILQLAQRGLDYACLVNESGSSAPVWQTTFSQTLTGDSPGWSGFTVRQMIPASMISVSGSQVRLTLQASTVGSFTIDGGWLGHGAVAGNVYNFDGTQVQFKVGASNGFTVAANTETVTDAVAYALNETRNFVVSLHFSATSAIRATNIGSGAMGAYKAAASEAATTAVTGYTEVVGSVYAVNKVEAFG